MVNIRKIKETEIEKVVRLWDEYCAEVGDQCLNKPEPHETASMFNRAATDDQAFCLVAEQEDEIVGFLIAVALQHPILDKVRAEIEALYIKPESRRTKVGTRLLNQAVSLLKSKGAATIRAHGLIEAPSARSFWQHLGWSSDLTTFSFYV